MNCDRCDELNRELKWWQNQCTRWAKLHKQWTELGDEWRNTEWRFMLGIAIGVMVGSPLGILVGCLLLT